MAKLEDVKTMTLDELRPIVQRALELEEWPGDWQAAGMILDSHTDYRIHRIPYNGSTEALIMSQGAIGVGLDRNPLIAIFRAYILWKAQVVKRK